jgi:hypothetical protein
VVWNALNMQASCRNPPRSHHSAAAPLCQLCIAISIDGSHLVFFHVLWCLLLYNAPPYSLKSSMTEAPENTTAEAASTPDSQAERIQYLTPTPPVFTPEYDYTAIVESIANTANFATAGSSEASPPQLLRVLEEIRRRGLCRSCFLENSGRSEWVSSAPPGSKSDAEWKYEQISAHVSSSMEAGKEVLVSWSLITSVRDSCKYWVLRSIWIRHFCGCITAKR